MEWPAKSPDLNIIENVWGILARDVYANARQFANVQELKNAIEAAWERLAIPVFQNLYKSLPKRMIAVIKKNGEIVK